MLTSNNFTKNIINITKKLPRSIIEKATKRFRPKMMARSRKRSLSQLWNQ